MTTISRKEQFLEGKLEKAGMTLKGTAGLITQSFEIEAMTSSCVDTLYDNLNSVGQGLATNKQINSGNGWNSDIHHDASLNEFIRDHGGLYGTETSSSPLDIFGYVPLKKELDRLLGIYKDASGDVRHTVRGSVHVHNTVSYLDDINSLKLDVKQVYLNIARLTIKFMPVMKWLMMTDVYGARGVRGSSYGDQFANDKLFAWYREYNDVSDDGFNYLTALGRQSCFRVYSRSSVHYENRLADCTFNSTHLAMWLSINKAITLFGIDFARNGFTFPLSEQEMLDSRRMMREHSNGFRNVDKNQIESLHKQFVSYLAKYLRITSSLDTIEVMDKLIKCPVSQYLLENDVQENYWDMAIIEKVFNSRNRASDDSLRDSYLYAIKSMSVPFADKLDEFHENIATHLGVESKKVKSLYQMFKRENVDIEFLGGRLVYLGD